MTKQSLVLTTVLFISAATAPPTLAQSIATEKSTPATEAAASSGTPRPSTTAIRKITRVRLPDLLRITIELDAEVSYHHERLEKPDRVFFDLKGARPVPELLDATLTFSDDDLVRKVRLGRQPQGTTRVVLDMQGVVKYSVFTLYNPFRLVIDCESKDANRRASITPSTPPVSTPVTTAPPMGAAPEPPPPQPRAESPLPAARISSEPAVLIAAESTVPTGPDDEPTMRLTPRPFPVAPVAAPSVSSVAPPSPVVPAVDTSTVASNSAAPLAVPVRNSSGTFSIARQLGLGASRIVIDPGHGGHDPGTRSGKLSEADLVLDVALRLEKLLAKQTGIEVIMTRRSDVFVPLEERTLIANREDADLFLSIHANASRNPEIRGVQTYFLNFATNSDSAAVAARENATSPKTMRNLPEIVRAITLNNKVDESRDFANIVHQAMLKKVRGANKATRDLGVRQAPFVVLIGAGMPSILAEVSFLSNKGEAQLLKTSGYRQRIAEALFDGVMRYQRSLKAPGAVAAQP